MDQQQSADRGTVTPPPAAGSITWTIPLQITVSVGTPTVAGGAEALRTEGAFAPAPPTQSPTSRFHLPSLSLPGFQWPAALSLALASELAYQNPGGVQSTTTTAWGFADCQFVSQGATQCFIATRPGLVLVSFRGTTDVRDWLSNLKIESKTLAGLTVHAGFLEQFQAVRAPLERVLNARRDSRVLLTGHSLGGALAVIAGVAWATKYQVGGLYTYGQPAVGRGDFTNYMRTHYSGRFFRFVNDSDIVPRVPPNYEHVGRLFHFDAAGRLSFEATESIASSGLPPGELLTHAEFEELQQQLRGGTIESVGRSSESNDAGAGAEGITTLFSDHAIARYIQKIQRFTR